MYFNVYLSSTCFLTLSGAKFTASESQGEPPCLLLSLFSLLCLPLCVCVCVINAWFMYVSVCIYTYFEREIERGERICSLLNRKMAYDIWNDLEMWRLFCILTVPGVCMHAQSLQSSLTLCNPMDYSLLGFTVHGILQAKILGWVVVSSSRGCSQPRDLTCVSCITDRFFTHWVTWEAWKYLYVHYFRVFFCKTKLLVKMQKMLEG